MDRAALENKIAALAERLAAPQGLQLVDVDYRQRGAKADLKIFLDKPGGITLDEVAEFSREFGTVLDVEDPIPVAYTLEVSSPGLTRPLRKPREFLWAKGKRVRLVLTAPPPGGQAVIEGRLIEIQGNDLLVEEEKNGRQTIPLANVKKANLEYEEKAP